MGQLLETILPAGIEVEEHLGEPLDGDLFPEEEEIVARAVEGRRREYATVRGCARRCLGRLGYPQAPIVSGDGGAPIWPDGVRGSMTHCPGYAAAAVSTAERISAIGIDAEPDGPLPAGVLDLIATPAERFRIAHLDSSHDSPRWDRLIFSAKESVFKVWFPRLGEWLEALETEIIVDPAKGEFTAVLSRGGLVFGDQAVNRLRGRWVRERGLLLTAAVVPVLSERRSPGAHDPRQLMPTPMIDPTV